jgi:hypothetical protein
MPRSRFQPEQWAKWIQDHSSSNLSMADFCASHHHFPLHSFYFWRRKLANTAKPKTSGKLADCKLARQKYSVPLLAEFRTWLDGKQFLPKSPTGEAARYTRNQWAALNRYVEDGRLAIDNNAAERLMKPVAIGRKNWLFVGSVDAGSRAAVLMSLVASCKLNEVEPWAYLRDVFTKMAARTSSESLDDLLPDRWLAAHPSHRWSIASLRRRNGRPDPLAHGLVRLPSCPIPTSNHPARA